MKVIPPNFGYVEEGIFRCGAPEPRHYGFLTSLGLRTCILLTDTHDSAFVHWLQETGVMIFCPLSSEAQTRGNFRGGGSSAVPQAYTTMSVSENLSFAQQASPVRNTNGGGPSGGLRDDGRDDSVAANDVFSPASGSGRYGGSADVLSTLNGGGGGGGGVGRSGDGVEGLLASGEGNDGNFDGSGNYGVDEASGGGRGGWPGPGTHSAATANGNNMAAPSTMGGGGLATSGTSNAARFLQENVAERQVSTKFSPVLVQERVFFPNNGRASGGNGGGFTPSSSAGVGGYQFVSSVSYEGRLHGLMTLSEAVVVSILHILLDPQYYPLLLTCSKGRYRSGIVCGCLRKLQGWNLVSILEEYRRFAGNKSRADNEEFIELFDEELVNLELPDGRRPTILYNR